MKYSDVSLTPVPFIDKPLVRYRWGVGLSTLPKDKFENIKDAISDRLKKLKVALAVFRQRYDDIEVVKNHNQYSLVRKVINKGILTRKFQLDFYQSFTSNINNFFSPHILIFLRVVIKEAKFLLKYYAMAANKGRR